VEACLRWVVGRGADTLDTDAESFPLVAALVLPGEPAEAVAEQATTARRTIRAAFEAVVAAGSIAGLEAAPDAPS
jgi:hypothetical protein